MDANAYNNSVLLQNSTNFTLDIYVFDYEEVEFIHFNELDKLLKVDDVDASTRVEPRVKGSLCISG